MDTLVVRPHHLETILGMLTMKELAPALKSGLYCEIQKKYVEEMIEAYNNNELKYITILPKDDDVCVLCDVKKKNDKCYQEEDKATLEGNTLEFGKHDIKELLKIFNPEKFYQKLMSEAQIY